MKNLKKAQALDLRIEMLGKMNDEYRKLIEMPEPDLVGLRRLALLYQERKMLVRSEKILLEVAVLEKHRKCVPISGIIEEKLSGYGGTNETVTLPVRVDNPVGAGPVGVLCNA